MGFGATPLYTLGLAFIEDSVAKDQAPVYIGMFLFSKLLLLWINFIAIYCYVYLPVSH